MSLCARVAVFLCLLAGSVGDVTAGSWRTDVAAAEREAAERGLPLILHFYADWCGPCRAMAPALESSTVTSLLGTEAIGVKVNIDRNRAVASRFGVAGLPSDVVVGPDGKTLARYVGQSGASTIASRIGRAADRVGPRPTRDETPKAETLVASADEPTEVEFGTDPAPPEDDTLSVLMKLAAGRGVGLAGFCPVALTRDRLWVRGDESLCYVFEGVTYRFADEVALELFIREPADYAPRYSGFDPTLLATEHVPVPGRIEFGSFHRDRLYLHASAGSRREFIADPTAFEVPAVIEVPESLAGTAGSGDRG